MFIRTSQPQPLNQKVLLRFSLPDMDHRFEVPGMVVCSNVSPRSAFPAGMGIKFLKIAPEDVQRIGKFVKTAGAEFPAPKKKRA